MPNENGGALHFNCMPVVVRGVVYPSHKAAAAALGVKPNTISQRLYATGSADTVGLNRNGGPHGNTYGAKPLRLHHLTFPSRKVAAAELGVTRGQLVKWIAPNASLVMQQMLYAALVRYDAKRAKEKTAQRAVAL